VSVLQPEVPAGDRTWRDTQRAPEVPPAPPPGGSTTLCAWRRALPAWSHTGCVCSLQETAPSPAHGSTPALHCAAHPSDSSTLPWRLLSTFHLGAMRNNAMNSFYSPLKKQFCSRSQTSRMTKTNFTRALSLYLILYVRVCPPVCTLAGLGLANSIGPNTKQPLPGSPLDGEFRIHATRIYCLTKTWQGIQNLRHAYVFYPYGQ